MCACGGHPIGGRRTWSKPSSFILGFKKKTAHIIRTVRRDDLRMESRGGQKGKERWIEAFEKVRGTVGRRGGQEAGK